MFDRNFVFWQSKVLKLRKELRFDKIYAHENLCRKNSVRNAEWLPCFPISRESKTYRIWRLPYPLAMFCKSLRPAFGSTLALRYVDARQQTHFFWIILLPFIQIHYRSFHICNSSPQYFQILDNFWLETANCASIVFYRIIKLPTARQNREVNAAIRWRFQFPFI